MNKRRKAMVNIALQAPERGDDERLHPLNLRPDVHNNKQGWHGENDTAVESDHQQKPWSEQRLPKN